MPSGRTIKHKISLTLGSDVINHFKELADNNGTSLSHEINKVLKEHKKVLRYGKER